MNNTRAQAASRLVARKGTYMALLRKINETGTVSDEYLLSLKAMARDVLYAVIETSRLSAVPSLIMGISPRSGARNIRPVLATVWGTGTEAAFAAKEKADGVTLDELLDQTSIDIALESIGGGGPDIKLDIKHENLTKDEMVTAMSTAEDVTERTPYARLVVQNMGNGKYGVAVDINERLRMHDFVKESADRLIGVAAKYFGELAMLYDLTDPSYLEQDPEN